MLKINRRKEKAVNAMRDLVLFTLYLTVWAYIIITFLNNSIGA